MSAAKSSCHPECGWHSTTLHCTRSRLQRSTPRHRLPYQRISHRGSSCCHACNLCTGMFCMRLACRLDCVAGEPCDLQGGPRGGAQRAGIQPFPSVARHSLSAVLTACGIRQDRIVPPLSLGAISPAEACAAAALLAGQQPRSIARMARDTEGDLPQDITNRVATEMYAVSCSAIDEIPCSSPQILFGQGNLRTMTRQDVECHAIVVAFSIEHA
mmetsp:Transcript_28450/g.72908  ORF Transcript_28450/g.72908 Transcript_28450/m.72908 type:complete len:214 (-) Transcript_28450:1120-1761(-)